MLIPLCGDAVALLGHAEGKPDLGKPLPVSLPAFVSKVVGLPVPSSYNPLRTFSTGCECTLFTLFETLLLFFFFPATKSCL